MPGSGFTPMSSIEMLWLRVEMLWRLTRKLLAYSEMGAVIRVDSDLCVGEVEEKGGTVVHNKGES